MSAHFKLSLCGLVAVLVFSAAVSCQAATETQTENVEQAEEHSATDVAGADEKDGAVRRTALSGSVIRQLRRVQQERPAESGNDEQQQAHPCDLVSDRLRFDNAPECCGADGLPQETFDWDPRATDGFTVVTPDGGSESAFFGFSLEHFSPGGLPRAVFE